MIKDLLMNQIKQNCIKPERFSTRNVLHKRKALDGVKASEINKAVDLCVKPCRESISPVTFIYETTKIILQTRAVSTKIYIIIIVVHNVLKGGCVRWAQVTRHIIIIVAHNILKGI